MPEKACYILLSADRRIVSPAVTFSETDSHF